MLWRPNRCAQIQRGWSPSAGRERRFWSGADLARGARMTPLSGSSAGLNGHGPAEPSYMKQRTAGHTGTAISGDRRPALSQHRGPQEDRRTPPVWPSREGLSCSGRPDRTRGCKLRDRGVAPGQHCRTTSISPSWFCLYWVRAAVEAAPSSAAFQSIPCK